MTAPGTLYHYTCAHARARIGKRGVLKPSPHPMLGNRRLIWLTDMATPERDALGLTSETLHCDRTEYRYRVVDPERAMPWSVWCGQHRVNRESRAVLESFSKPERWWVSEVPLRCRLDKEVRR